MDNNIWDNSVSNYSGGQERGLDLISDKMNLFHIYLHSLGTHALDPITNADIFYGK